MNVCVDIQAAIAQRAGVGRYTKMLVEHLPPFAGEDELTLFYFDFKRNGAPFPVPGARQKAVHWIPGRLVQKAWKTIHAPPFDAFAGAADVYHFPNFIRPPLSRGKSVVTIHDVSFLRHPETMEPGNYAYMSGCIADTVRDADAIITDCNFIADELHELLDVPRAKLRPIHLGLPTGVKRPGDAVIRDVKKQLGLDRPYLLHVGTVEPRKNHQFLFEVFEALEKFDGDLVFAGMKGWKVEPIFQRLQQSPRADRIRYLDYVRDEDLSALYAGAEVFLFPSLYEGFGFPPLEAMKCGTPVVSSTAGSLTEVLGDGACLIEGYDRDEWVAVITGLLTHQERREARIRHGVEKSRTYNWAETARKTWGVYREVGG